MIAKKTIVAAAIGGLVAGVASLSTVSTAQAGEKGHCHGVNSCKHTGDCGGKGHSCAGKNECKGKGWKKMSHSECDKKGGKWKKS